MAQQRDGMVEKRGAGLWLTHVFMILGVLVIFFPIWLAFVASTVTQPKSCSRRCRFGRVTSFGKTIGGAVFRGKCAGGDDAV